MKERVRGFFLGIGKDLKKSWFFFLILFLYYKLMHGRFHAFCPFLILTGFPCPGCGMVRAMLFLLTGQLQRAWNLNPMAVGWLLCGVWLLYRRYWCQKEIKEWKYLALALGISMTLLYGYRMYQSFPGHPPMVYRRDNVMAHFIPGYEEYLRKWGIL